MTGNKTGNETRETGLEIAVIGMDGQFPGAKHLHEFWENLKNGVEAISFFSDEELKAGGVDPETLENPGYIKAKPMLSGVEYFDDFFFGYTPKEAEIMDPQVRIFHGCAWRALEDAGWDSFSYGRSIGLYAGAAGNYHWLGLCLHPGTRADGEMVRFESRQLFDRDYLSTRTAHKLNLRGPAISIQAACSTALVAIHMACQGLLSGECDMALAGGVSILNYKKEGYWYQEGMIESPDGHCRAFDAAGQGTVFGDGIGVVVLKRLAEAIRDRDHIYAVIKGSFINNDGSHRAGFTAPAIEGQAEVISAALKIAEVEPESIGYLETHGTGTNLGDPVEIQGLKMAFAAAGKSEKHSCRIGSVKTNVGHLNIAAGAAGFIKTVLVLYYGMIPPSLHFNSPNPQIDFENSPFVVNTGLTRWKRNRYPRRAGVSSFGIGGTNAHVVLEEWPGAQSAERTAHGEECMDHGPWSQGRDAREYQLIVLSAKTGTALEKMTQNLAEYFKKNFLDNGKHENPANPGPGLADAAYTLQVGRRRFKHGRITVCKDIPGAIAGLSLPHPGKTITHYTESDNPPVVFMFPGLGSQYVNMGRDLYREEPLFREEMHRCFEVLNNLVDYDIKEIIYPPDQLDQSDQSDRSGKSDKSDKSDWSDILINQTEIAQLVLFIFEYALAKLLIHWGIKPQAMIGYSFGEYTAACISGVFSPEDALKLLARRGQLLEKTEPGVMLSIPLNKEELIPLLPGELSFSIDNGASCIVSGSLKAVSRFEKKMKERRCITMRLPGTRALHSHLVEPAAKELPAAAASISRHEPRIPYLSNVSGDWLTPAEAVNPGYWSEHLRKPVCFADGMKKLVKTPGAIFVEIGPGRDLAALAIRFLETEEKAGNSPAQQRVVNLVRHVKEPVNDCEFLLRNLGQLWLYGVKIDWSGFHWQGDRHRVSLPTYPFEEKRYWIEARFPGPPDEVSAGEAPGEVIESGIDSLLAEAASLSRPSTLCSAYVPPANPLQESLANIWQRFFGIQPLGTGDNFFELGGDSLKAINLSAVIREELNIDIPIEEFFERQTIGQLEEYIKTCESRSGDTVIHPIKAVEKKEYYPVSPAQKRLYVQQQVGETGIAYNETLVLKLTGEPREKQLADTFEKIICRHESLRTGFEIIDGTLAQRIHDDVEFEMEYHQSLGGEQEQSPFLEGTRGLAPLFIKEFIRPFDLSRAPLLRVGLISTGENRYILVLDMHHIIMDGTSQEILVRDFVRLYQGEKLPALFLQYKDFSLWRFDLLGSREIKKQEEYWLKEFSGEIPVLNLPLDYPRPLEQRFKGSRVYFVLEKEKVLGLKELASREKVTLFMILLAVFNILLSKLSGQTDIVVGTGVEGRSREEWRNIIGIFVNTLPLRNYPTGEKTFREFLTGVKEQTLQAFKNRDYPFEDLVAQLKVHRETNRNPLFDVLFQLETIDVPEVEIEGLEFSLHQYDTGESKFDIRMWAVEIQGELSFTVEYFTTLFKKETIQRFTSYYREIAAVILEDNDIRLKDINLAHDLGDSQSNFKPGDYSDFKF